MMTNENNNAARHNTRGAVVKLFGVIMIILGALNTMLSWRGGFEMFSLPVTLLASGALLCVIGAIMRTTMRGFGR